MRRLPDCVKNFWLTGLALCLLGILVFSLYCPVRDFEFVNWDDDLHVFRNNSIRSFHLQDIRSWFTEPCVGLYIPIPIMTYALEYHFSGNEPARYHRTNLWLHVANVLLVFLVLKFFFRNHWFAFWGALLFGIHPVQVESVAWISERKNLLYALFFLMSFLCFTHLRRKGEKKTLPYAAVCVLFLLALLSKITAVSGLAIFAAYDYFYSASFSKRKKVIYVLGTAVVGFASVLTLRLYPRVLRVLAEGKVFSVCFDQAGKCFLYLKHIFCPLGLRILYPEKISLPLGDLGGIAFGVILLLFGIVLVYGIIKRKEFGFWIFWFLAFLAPVITFFPVPVGDRHLYLPLLGVIALGVLIGKKWKTLSSIFLIAVIFLLVPISREQIESWRDSGRLWGRVLNYEPDSFQANFKLAGFYESRKDFRKAFGFYEELIRKHPDAFPYPYVNLYNLYTLSGQTGSAKRIADGFRRYYPAAPDLDLLYRMLLQWKRDPRKGMSFFDEALALKKGNAGAYETAGEISMQDGDFEEAARCFEEALAVDPGSKMLRAKREKARSAAGR
ncbi:MAG TPA: tetratricopeptide repeat protein [Candidatus Omnitrophota bacterium]|nr:tetratricopeptide repeat protein [Candidatus Omnitrophota bacterium]